MGDRRATRRGQRANAVPHWQHPYLRYQTGLGPGTAITWHAGQRCGLSQFHGWTVGWRHSQTPPRRPCPLARLFNRSHL
jgi:hypothetical protein